MYFHQQDFQILIRGKIFMQHARKYIYIYVLTQLLQLKKHTPATKSKKIGFMIQKCWDVLLQLRSILLSSSSICIQLIHLIAAVVPWERYCQAGIFLLWGSEIFVHCDTLNVTFEHHFP